MDLLARVDADPDGRRLRAVAEDARAEKRRKSGHGPRLDGAFGEAALLTGDALVDVVAGRTPRRWTVAAAEPQTIARELVRRLRGPTMLRRSQEAHHLRHEPALEVRVVEAIGAPVRSPLADPVVTLRAPGLVLSGPAAGELRGDDRAITDLLDGRLGLADPTALDRRPEGLVTLARLAARPELQVDNQARALAAAARAEDALSRARLSRLGYALDDLLAAPEAIAALELLRGFAPSVRLHEIAEVDGALLRRADAQLADPSQRPLMVLLALARRASRSRVRNFAAGAVLRSAWPVRFDGHAAHAVVAAAGPERLPVWAA